MRMPIACSLIALALYSLCSQGLALAFIWLYSQPGHPMAHLGILSACGALGLAAGQVVNLALLFKIGSHRMVTLASILLILLFPFSVIFFSFPAHLLARFTLGAIDGMIFLVIENALVLFAPAKLRASMLSAYLFTLYGTALASPLLGSCLIDGNAIVAGTLLLCASLAPLAFFFTPRFLENQAPSFQWTLGEKTFVQQGLKGAFLCALSGAVLPLWTAFLPALAGSSFPLYKTYLATGFCLGGLSGQLFIIALQGRISSDKLATPFLLLSLIAGMLLLTEIAENIAAFGIAISVLAFTLFPLYGLGVDRALTQIPQDQWVRANKTLLSCYTIPAIVSPLIFPLYPLPLPWRLPLFTVLGSAVALAITQKSQKKRA
jgi:MFS family permease